MDEHIENNIADVLLNEMWNSNMYILTKISLWKFPTYTFFASSNIDDIWLYDANDSIRMLNCLCIKRFISDLFHYDTNEI